MKTRTRPNNQEALKPLDQIIRRFKPEHLRLYLGAVNNEKVRVGIVRAELYDRTPIPGILPIREWETGEDVVVVIARVE